MLLVQGRIAQKYGFLCALLAVLVSQGIVVKCTAAIFFRTVVVMFLFTKTFSRLTIFLEFCYSYD